jgi:hypothetical protein
LTDVTTTNPYEAVAAYEVWKDTPLVSDLFRGKASAELHVMDHRMRDRGILGDVKAWMDVRRTRATALGVLDLLFRRSHSLLKADRMRVFVSIDEKGTSIMLLPPSGRVMQIYSQDLEDYVCYCAGYLSPRGWLWTDGGRLKHLPGASTENCRFAAEVMAA